MDDMISRHAAIDAVRKANDKSEAHRMLAQLPTVDAVPCDVCRFAPPSSGDGKPCTICPAEGKDGDGNG